MKLTLSSLPKTWILDLDGTLVVHNGYKIYGKDIWLKGAREFLLSLPQEDMIIFLTSRSKEYAKQTESFLKESGICYANIIYEAPYGERILINDNKPSGLCMAHAVDGQRDRAWDFQYTVDETL